MGRDQIEKFYQIIVGVTVALMAGSFASLPHGFEAIHAVWLVTIYIIAVDWWDSTGYEYFDEDQGLVIVNMLYLLALLALPLTLRLAHSKEIPVFWYPTVLLVTTVIDMIYIRKASKFIRNDTQKQVRFGVQFGWDVIAAALYCLIIALCLLFQLEIDWVFFLILFGLAVVVDGVISSYVQPRIGNWFRDIANPEQ